jgi:hypothetical protein
MSLGIILTVLGGGSALLAYALIERRINQRACPQCGFRVSVDAAAEQCPRCGDERADGLAAGSLPANSLATSSRESCPPPKDELSGHLSVGSGNAPNRCEATQPRSAAKHPPGRRRLQRLSWLVLLAPPLALVIVDGSMAILNWSKAPTDKAISLVKSSSSRIENFTVQQYLYSTLYDKKEKGADVTIEGWRAEQQPGSDRLLTVEFNYTDEHRPHTAVWEVDLAADKVTPRNEDALDLSWK